MSDDKPTATPVIFKDIPGFPGYQVCNSGLPWSFKLKGGNDRAADRLSVVRKPMRVYPNKRGYLFVNLTRDGRNHHLAVHKLVLEAFVGPCPPGMEACHYPDPDPSNNRPENLRWDTHPENMKDKYRDRPPATEKFCRKCDQLKPVVDFYCDKRSSDGLCCYCKRCHCRISVDTANKDRRRTRNREYMREWKKRKSLNDTN